MPELLRRTGRRAAAPRESDRRGELSAPRRRSGHGRRRLSSWCAAMTATRGNCCAARSCSVATATMPRFYMPYHLLGVETATSIFSAAVLGLPTGGLDAPVTEVGIRDRQPACRSTPRHGPRPRHPGATPVFTARPGAPIACPLLHGGRRDSPSMRKPERSHLPHDRGTGSVLWAMKRERTGFPGVETVDEIIV